MKLIGTDIGYGFDSKALIQKKLNFCVAAGECLWISGENGSGKSLLGRVLAGHHPHQGNLENQFLRSGYLPQIQEPQNHLPYSLGDVAKKAHFLSSDQLKLPWNSASGGERQKALLDHILYQNFDLLILDEPFNHLDQPSKRALQQQLVNLGSMGKVGLVLISHDLSPQDWWIGTLHRLHLEDPS